MKSRHESHGLTLTGLVGLVGLIGLTAVGQTNTEVMATNLTTVTVPEFITQIWNTTFGAGLTNLSVTTYGTYTPSIKSYGAGVVVTRNIPLGNSGFGTGIGLGLDYYKDGLYALNAQVSLQADMKPLSALGGFLTNVIVTPSSSGWLQS